MVAKNQLIIHNKQIQILQNYLLMINSNSLKVYLIRHTESQYNAAMKKAVGLEREVLASQQDLSIKFSKNLMDCGITQRGYDMCEKVCEQAKKLNIKIVLASPLKRSLISAQQFFLKHPSNPKIIIQPLLTQMMLSCCDIGANILESKIRLNFDFSFLQNVHYKKLWMLQNLPQKEQLLTEIRKRVKSEDQMHQNGHLHLLNMMRDKFPNFYETLENVQERSLKLKKKIFQKYQHMLGQNQQIALVVHFRIAQCITAKSFNENHIPVDGLHLNNATITEVILQ